MTVCSVDNLEQTMFLGCSIIDFTCSLGLNEQPTEITVRLARDTCASPAGRYKVYYDITQPKDSIRQQWTAADPGLSSFGINNNETPILGAPVYFRVNNFEFMGILQSWTKLNVQSDQDIYEVKLTSPTEVLAGCQVIVGDYSGPIKGFNIFNVYGFQEYFNATTNAPSYTDPNAVIDGPIMGSYAGAFGGANANQEGMTWNKIRQGISLLTSSLTPVDLLGYSDFSQVGRIIYFGGQVNGKFGLIPRDAINSNIGLAFGLSSDIATYYLDISEIPNVPEDYRIQGPSINLLSLISQICNDFGLDFYLDCVPIKDGAFLRKYIKIRTISRSSQPDLNIVHQFVSATSEVTDSSFGRELRNENTTTFLVGGNKQSIWEVDYGLPNVNDDPEEAWFNYYYGSEYSVRQRISQFFGIDSYGNAYTLNTAGISNPLDYYLNLEIFSKHTWKVLAGIIPNTLQVTVGEMRAAEMSYSDWAKYSIILNTDFRQRVLTLGFDIDSIFAGMGALMNANARLLPRDIAKLHSRELVDQLAAELRIYRQIIADIYTQSKNTLMVRVPWVASRYQIDSTTVANVLADLQIQRTDDPSDGGWSESDVILYLSNPGVYIDRLRLEDGRIKPFAMFDIVDSDQNGPGLSSATTTTFDTAESFALDRQLSTLVPTPFAAGHLLYYTFQQDDQLVYLDRKNLKSPRVVIRFSNPLDFNNDSNPFFAKNGWSIVKNQALFNRLQNLNHKHIENELLINLVGEQIRFPETVAIALKSNNFVYGPWKPNNILEGGPPGQIKFEKDDNLVPWVYGSVHNLNNIGQARANAAIAVMTEGEVGNITVPGWPNIPLGAEIASLSGLTTQFFDQAQHLIENRYPVFESITLIDNNNNNITFITSSYSFGYWNGSFGPTITNINVDVSSASNITTTYSFRTYSPKFGIISKLNADRLQRLYIGENKRLPRERFLRELRRLQRQYVRGLRKLSQVGDPRATQGTPHSVLAGQLSAWDSNIVAGIDNSGDGVYRRSIVATESLLDIQSSLYSSSGYNNTAIMSLDGLIRPISMSGDGGLPRYVANISQAKSNSPGAIPPFGTGSGDISSLYNYDISLKYLNPLSNPSGFNYAEIQSKHTGIAGHDIDILARGDFAYMSGSGYSLILPVDVSGFNSLNRADYTNDYRFLGLRGPLVMQGWGYDTDGKPIPNAADSEINIVNSGRFATTNLQDKFLPNFLRKPQTWPVAPVDLRFDRYRNVWTAPPQYEFVIATLDQTISGYSTGAATFSVTGAYDSLGNTISSGHIVLHDQVGSTYTSGSKVVSYYDVRLGQYNIISAQGAGGSGGTTDTKIVLIDQDISGASGCTNSTYSGVNLYGYTRTVVNLKYYIPVTTSGQTCYVSGANSMILSIMPTGSGSGAGYTYNTVPIFYDDEKPFILDSYVRSDYPTYPENSSFPPTGVASSFFKKKYRGIAINNILVTSMCRPLPAPTLPSG